MSLETLKRELVEIVGGEWVRSGPNALKSYFEDPIKDCKLTVVMPDNEFDLSEVMVAANEENCPVFSVRREFLDESLAAKEGILLDLSRMNEVRNVDRRNLMAHAYTGVTFEQLQKACLEKECKVLLPAAATSKQVLRSYIDRDVLNGNGGYRFPNLSIFHAAIADGRIWVSGNQQMVAEGISDFREDQGPQFSLFFGASEDIYGVPFYGIVYTYPLREMRRCLAFSFDSLEKAGKFAWHCSREEHVFEVITANQRYLGTLLGKDAADADKIASGLPQWITFISMEHRKELVELWTKYNTENAALYGGKPFEDGILEKLDKKYSEPWYVWDRNYYKGRTSLVTHYDFYKNIDNLSAGIRKTLAGEGFDDVGQAFIPVYFGGAVYCETDIYFKADEKEKAKKARMEAYKYVIGEKSFVDRPNGDVAAYLYPKVDDGYKKLVRYVKEIVDPKGILNPGQLMEGV